MGKQWSVWEPLTVRQANDQSDEWMYELHNLDAAEDKKFCAKVFEGLFLTGVLPGLPGT